MNDRCSKKDNSNLCNMLQQANTFSDYNMIIKKAFWMKHMCVAPALWFLSDFMVWSNLEFILDHYIIQIFQTLFQLTTIKNAG